MLSAIVKKEILNNLLNLRFSLAYFLCTFLIVGSGALMLGDFANEKRSYDLNSLYYAHDLDAATSATAYANTPVKIARRPYLTKIFAIGGERDADAKAEAGINGPALFLSDFKRNPLTNLFPSLDMVFVVGVIVSLLVFILTFDSVSGEREEGTLKALFSCPVPRDTVYLGKWLGGSASLIIPLITAWVAVMLLLFFAAPSLMSVDEAIRMVLILGMCLLYVVALFSLAMAISVLARTSALSILLLLVIWAVGVLVLPSLGIQAGYLLSKATGVDVFQMETMLSIKKNLDEFQENMGKEWEKLFASGNVTQERQEETVKIINRMSWQFGLEIATDLSRRYTNNEVRSENYSRWLSRLSPYGCLQNACVSIAGTGMLNEKSLRASLLEYQKRSVAYATEVSLGTQEFDMTKAPRPVLTRSSIASALSESFIDIAILCIMAGLCFLVGYARFLRMDIQ